jgi:hypothetical protein
VNSIYWQIRRHIANAARLIEWSNADITYGGSDDPDAAQHLQQAHEELAAAKALVDQHRPAVSFCTVRVGTLVEIDQYGPTEWAHLLDKDGVRVSVRWSQIVERAA